MDTAIHIAGNSAAAESVSTALIYLMQAGYEYRMDQKTIRKAMEILSKQMPDNRNISISNSNFQG